MAKMFYSSEEVQEKLGRSGDEIKQLVRDGQLREFRDGAKIMFKVDEVDKLSGGSASESSGSDLGMAPLGGSGDHVSLSESDSSGLILDQSGSGFDLTASGSGSDISLSPMGDSADLIDLDDSTVPSVGKDDTVITAHGASALGESDSQAADGEGIDLTADEIDPDLADQVTLDSGSSGSGLLDLSREADDTSLGMELLDEIYPGAETDEGSLETQVPTPGGLETPMEPAESAAEAAVLPEAAESSAQAVQMEDPSSGAFGAMLLVPLVFLIYLSCVTASGVLGVQPAILEPMNKYTWMVMGGAMVVSFMVLGIGIMMGRDSEMPAKPKSKKTKPKKPAKKKKK
ncbi:MAG: helix-turn-helix domain-containing protein [Planctomycetes bacterium]|nr:helix-turn-helix domain-containing protein [Planctomycetota bacterium]